MLMSEGGCHSPSDLQVIWEKISIISSYSSPKHRTLLETAQEMPGKLKIVVIESKNTLAVGKIHF